MSCHKEGKHTLYTVYVCIGYVMPQGGQGDYKPDIAQVGMTTNIFQSHI